MEAEIGTTISVVGLKYIFETQLNYYSKNRIQNVSERSSKTWTQLNYYSKNRI